MTVNWKKEAENRKEAFVAKTKELLSIPSVYDQTTVEPGKPSGKEVAKALDFMLQFCEESGFKTHNVDGYAAHAEYGDGDDIIGVLCHLDVVPAGDGWTSDPFQPEVRDGKLYARGAIDDKGPTMAAVFALKMVKELGLPLNKRVRLIFGTDEEVGDWIGIKKYFEAEPMPLMGFAPDANFPLINAEKGIFNFHLVQQPGKVSTERQDGWRLQSFTSGNATNMVPDLAEATLVGTSDVFAVKERFQSYVMEHGLEGKCEERKGQLYIRIKGVSHHGMEPDQGLNAGLTLARFLNVLDLDARGHQFIGLVHDYFVDSFFGEKLGIAFSDEVTGPLTVNVGTLNYAYDGEARLGISLRYPVSDRSERFVPAIEAAGDRYGFALGKDVMDQVPHHVAKEHELVQTLLKVYSEQMGENAEPLSTGGGTYGRALDVGVAFGALFPGEPETAHQRDENADVDNLCRAMAIYAQAIYELAK